MQKAVQALTRAGNLAKGAVPVAAVDTGLFTAEAEAELYAAYTHAKEAVDGARAARDYGAVLKAVSGLAEPVNKFFDAVMVMDKDEKIRNNRLALLKAIIALTDGFADVSKIIDA